MTARLALVGHPVAHSRSPAMMAAAFRARGIDATYALRDTPPGTLGETLRGLWSEGYVGANVTVPWKAEVFARLTEVDEAARRCGAVNTLVRAATGFEGANTDVAGFTRALAESAVSLRGQHVVVLGAGGAARAVVAATTMEGAASVTVLARRPARGAVAFGTTEAVAALTAGTVIVQATPCGMDGGPPGEAIVRAADLAVCARGTVAVDLVYAPRETTWMRAARTAGLQVLEPVGASMLVHQGAAAFERWFGGEAPVEVMREAAFGRP